MPLAAPSVRRRRRVVGSKKARMVGRMRRFRRKILGTRVHKFTEKAQLASISVPGGATVYNSQSYKLADLTNAASYATLFDLYKLKAVKLTMVPLVSNSEATFTNTAGQAGALPMLYVAPNRDPFVPPPASIADVLNDDGCKVIRLNKPTSFYLSNPKPLITDTRGDQMPFQFNVGTQPWLTTGGNSQYVNQITVPHYGHRIVLTNNAAADLVIQLYVKYYFELKEQD